MRTCGPITAFGPTTVPAPMRAPGATRAVRSMRASSNSSPSRSSASTTTWSPTWATAATTAIRRRRRRIDTETRSRSPGTTWRRKRALLTPRSTARRVAVSPSGSSSSTAAAWTKVSIIKTPGITGLPGKWPWKNSSLTVTFLTATRRAPGSCSTTSSSSTEG